MHTDSHQRGFTLLEFSMVMILFGVLMGSVLRGQELITSAKVRNMLDQKSAIQSALIAFSDRHQVNAGDLDNTQALLIDPAMVASAVGGNGVTTLALTGANNESATALQNLTIGRYLSCRPCLSVTNAAPNPLSDNNNSLANVMGNFVSYGYSTSSSGVSIVWWDAVPAASRSVITTGAAVSAQMLREMDLKGDDGSPGSGNFRLSSVGTSADFSVAACAVGAGAASTWITSDSINCAGAWLVP